jgi:NADH dehydrogenase FAD-containing subunit
VIEMLDRVCSDLGPLNRADVLERIGKTSVKIMLKTKALDLTENGLRAAKDGKEEVLKCPDTIVVAMGADPNPLTFQSKGKIHYVGDCRKVGNAMDAIHDAFHVAINL